METVLYHLRSFWLQVEEYLTKNGLNDTCLSSHITGSSETGSFRAIDSTKQKCSQESASYLSPGQSLAFWFCLWATVTARWPSMLQASHPHTTGIKGKENYSFYQRGKDFPNPPPSILPLGLTGQNWISYCLAASTTLNQSLAKENGIIVMVKTNLDSEGTILLERTVARHLIKIRVLLRRKKGGNSSRVGNRQCLL